MRNLKLLGYVAGGLIALLAVVLIAVSLLVNPNDYKGRIADEVKKTTGRELRLAGDIKLSVFPWIALELGPLTLGNPEGFGPEPFLSVRHAALRVRLLPLLHKSLEVGRLEVDGLDLRLTKNAAGKGNWEDFGSKREAPPASSGGSTGTFGGLGGIDVKDSRISYDELVVSGANLEVGRVAAGEAVPVKASLAVNTGPAGKDLTLTAALNVTLDPASKHYALGAVSLGGDLKMSHEARPVPWKFTAESVDLDLAGQTLKAPSFAASAGDARIVGSLAGDRIVDAPEMHASLKLEAFSPRALFRTIGVDLPPTRDASVWSKLAGATDVAYGHNALGLEKLDVRLDDSQLQGSLAITNLDTHALRFNLKLDRIDLDRYRGPVAAPAGPAATAPAELPTTALRPLRADGTFAVGSARVAGLSMSDLEVTLHADEGLVHLAPIRARLYSGTYTGDITYDAREAVPRISVGQQVTGVDMALLLKDAVKSERLSGRGNASVKLAGAGRTSDALMRALAGRVEMNLVDGAVQGVDLWYEIDRAQALLKQQPGPSGSNDHRTKFDTFRASADVAGGVATTKDLNIASQYLRITGTGSSNFVTEAIDYHLVANVLKSPPTAQGGSTSALALGDVPVAISGTMADPKVRPDVAGLVKSKLKQKLEDTVKSKLQDLFKH